MAGGLCGPVDDIMGHELSRLTQPCARGIQEKVFVVIKHRLCVL